MNGQPGADSDPWLERWLDLLKAQASAPRVLELGCGEGRDTQTLLDAGLDELTALDLSAEAVARCRARSDRLIGLIHDLREPLPFADEDYDVVIASLCLHYFSWQDTERVVRELHRVLRPSGLLLCRVNSVTDVHYGAVGYPELERHLYRVNGQPKRFFDRDDLHCLFGADWNVISEQELQIHRYQKPKSVYEVILTKRD